MKAWLQGTACAVISLAGCNTPSSTGPGGGAASATNKPIQHKTALSNLRAQPSVQPPAEPTQPWTQAAREQRWKRADKLLAALPQAERSKPEIRFAMGRVAAELNKPKDVLEALDGIDKQLPTLATHIKQLRAEAALKVGPYKTAVEHFSKRGDWLSVAKAHERAQQYPEAIAAVAKGLNAIPKKSRKRIQLEVPFRELRARIAETTGKPSLAERDLRWLSTRAPTSQAGRKADERLAQIAPHRALNLADRRIRLDAFADRGLVEDVNRELQKSQRKSGQTLSAAHQLYARGWALYRSRSDYKRAAELLEKASKLNKEYKSKRLLLRRHVRGLEHTTTSARLRCIRAYPNSFRRADLLNTRRYLRARLLYIMGSWPESRKRLSRVSQIPPKEGSLSGFCTLRTMPSQSSLGDATTQRSKPSIGSSKSSHVVEKKAATGSCAVSRFRVPGKKDAAIKAFRFVIRQYPLSFAALASAARLRELKAPLPPVIEPATTIKKRAPLAIALPATVATLTRLGFDADAEDELKKHEGTLRKRYAPRGDEALCLAYGRLSSAARRYRIGQRAARWTDLSKAPNLKNRWLWDCVYPKPYESTVRKVEEKRKLPLGLIYAVMRQESAFAPTVVSPAHAVGLMQMIPPTAKRVAEELALAYDPTMLKSPPTNIEMGGYYLRRVYDRFGQRVALTAAAYNAGPAALSRWLESGEKLPLDVFVARIPYRETRGYVNRVVGNWATIQLPRDGRKRRAQARPQATFGRPRQTRRLLEAPSRPKRTDGKMTPG